MLTEEQVGEEISATKCPEIAEKLYPDSRRFVATTH